MLEIMQFIFSSFWIWLGTLLLITALGGSLSRILNLTVTRINKTVNKAEEKKPPHLVQ
jgi:hypothetical protein